jgi:hypothetical protein
MWPTCRTRRKQPSSLKRLPPPRKRLPALPTANSPFTIEGRDGAFAAYVARPKVLPAPAVVVLQELFASARLATNWQSRVSPPSHPIYSGVRSRALILTSRRRLTGSTAFAFIKPLIVTLASEILQTPWTLWPNCLSARARLPSRATVSAP